LARALANTGAGALWVVERSLRPRPGGEARAGADQVLEGNARGRTLEEAVEDCVDVVMTTGRPVPGALEPRASARLREAPGEARSSSRRGERAFNPSCAARMRASDHPTAQKSSLELAQAVLVFGYEGAARGATAKRSRKRSARGREKLLAMLRRRGARGARAPASSIRSNPTARSTSCSSCPGAPAPAGARSRCSSRARADRAEPALAAAVFGGATSFHGATSLDAFSPPLPRFRSAEVGAR